MKIDRAREILNGAIRHELRDHAFGDTEVMWIVDGVEVGGGYFGKTEEVWVMGSDGEKDGCFTGDYACRLRVCGKSSVIERNDETGPDNYAEGVTMPGLTLEGVRKELEGR